MVTPPVPGRAGAACGISLVRNVPVRSEAVASILAPNLGLQSDDFVAIYQGALTINHGIETLLAMAPQLNNILFTSYSWDTACSSRKSWNPCDRMPTQHRPVPYEVLDYTGDADVGWSR